MGKSLVSCFFHSQCSVSGHSCCYCCCVRCCEQELLITTLVALISDDVRRAQQLSHLLRLLVGVLCAHVTRIINCRVQCGGFTTALHSTLFRRRRIHSFVMVIISTKVDRFSKIFYFHISNKIKTHSVTPIALVHHIASEMHKCKSICKAKPDSMAMHPQLSRLPLRPANQVICLPAPCTAIALLVCLYRNPSHCSLSFSSSGLTT